MLAWISANTTEDRRLTLPLPLLKVLVFVAGLAPAGWLLWRFFTYDLGAEPVETILHTTGDWGLRFLLITLAVTPLRLLTGWTLVMRLRRMLGLFAFFYATLHMLTYLALEQFFAWGEILEDVLERPYITLGFLAWVLLVPLAVTSTNGMMRRLGRRWKQLHQSVYVIAAAAVIHYLLLVKADTREPIIYGLILVALLGVRAWNQRRSPRA